MSPKEFIEMAEKKALQLVAIKKEVPPKSGRWMLLGFETNGRSRKHHVKYLLAKPIWMDDLKEKKPAIAP